MAGKKSFLIVIRIFFVLFSLHFIKVAFYRWDGFSYFIPFKDILPDFSLAFISWTISGLILATFFWLFTYWFAKKLSLLRVVQFEYLMVWFLFVALSVFIYGTIHDYFYPSYELIKFVALILLVFLSIACVWYLERKNRLEKILFGFDDRIKPLVWLFSFLLIFSVAFSIYKKDSIKTSAQENKVSFVHSENERPNIILVTMDALSAKNMQAYGYHRPTTPFIAEWAKDAVLFKRAYSTSNWTTPAVMSIMTGQLPWTHRIWYEPHYYPVVNYKNNLPRILKENGYKIYGFIQNTLAHPKILGIGEAFLIKDEAYTFLTPHNWWVDKLTKLFSRQRIATEMMLENNPLFKPLNLKHSQYLAYVRLVLYSSLIRSEKVYKQFLVHLSQNLEEPFFAWIHVLPPHDPYLPPKPYSGLFGDPDKFNTGEKQLAANLLYQTYNPDRQSEVDILRKRYDESILYSDKQFEIFLERLSRIVDMSKTVIILSSDHGESFSHGYVAHNGEFIYEPLIKIPLIIKIPWKTNGGVEHTLVSQIDIAPTILDLAGIPVPKWMEGRSLLPLIEDRPFEPKEVFSMQLIRNSVIGNTPITKGTIAVLKGEYKLISYIDKKKVFLFNLQDDPYEQQNLANKETETVKRLKKLIDERLFIINKKVLHN
jgi:arylsulfatase A-like enzyme